MIACLTFPNLFNNQANSYKAPLFGLGQIFQSAFQARFPVQDHVAGKSGMRKEVSPRPDERAREIWLHGSPDFHCLFYHGGEMEKSSLNTEDFEKIIQALSLTGLVKLGLCQYLLLSMIFGNGWLVTVIYLTSLLFYFFVSCLNEQKPQESIFASQSYQRFSPHVPNIYFPHDRDEEEQYDLF